MVYEIEQGSIRERGLSRDNRHPFSTDDTTRGSPLLQIQSQLLTFQGTFQQSRYSQGHHANESASSFSQSLSQEITAIALCSFTITTRRRPPGAKYLHNNQIPWLLSHLTSLRAAKNFQNNLICGLILPLKSEKRHEDNQQYGRFLLTYYLSVSLTQLNPAFSLREGDICLLLQQLSGMLDRGQF